MPRSFVRRAWFWALVALGASGLLAAIVPRLVGTRVAVVAATHRTIVEKVVVSGRVLAPARVSIAPLVTGRVARIATKEGDHVRAGDVLVELDASDARATLAQARAGVRQARARLDQTRTVSATLAAENHRQADANLAHAELESERAIALRRSGSATDAYVDETRRALDVARSQHDAAEAQERSTGKNGADHRLALAAVEQALAVEAAAEVHLAQHRVLCPADGVVLQRSAEPGDIVASAQTVLVVAVDGATRLTVSPDEKALAKLRLGQSARASADAFPDAPFDATVSYLAPAIDPLRGTVEVRLDVPSAPAFLRPDMTVSVDIETARHPDALVIPADAVRDLATRAPWVLVVAEHRAERRDVKLGVRGDTDVEILAGVDDGELAITSPVAEGRRVRVPGSR